MSRPARAMRSQSASLRQLKASDDSVRARAVEELCSLDNAALNVEAIVQLIQQHRVPAVRVAAGTVLAKQVILELQHEDEQVSEQALAIDCGRGEGET